MAETRIVIVEDEPDTADMLGEMMRLSGYTVIKSFGGESAMALIAREKPQAVLLDMMMPDLSGLEVLRFIRRDPRLEDIPVIVVSARTLPEDIQSGLTAGATAYLTKPVAFKDLQAVVRKSLRPVEE